MIIQEKILDCLKRKQEHVSGDLIATRLGISRQALWKHIQDLKEAGYDIVAVPHLGYRLISRPDRLFAFEVTRDLGTRILAKKVCYFDSLASTMDVAMKLALDGSPEGTLVIAESQTQGRGRMGRSWFSPKYKGIYFSLILRPEMLPSRASLLTLFCAVSLCEAIKKICDLEAGIKWPNDIWLSNRKIGGILTELSAEMDAINFVIIGVGLNVNNDKKSLVSGATSLKEHKGESVNRIELLQEILKRIEANYLMLQEKEGEGLLEKARAYSLTIGRRVRVSVKKEQVEGVALGIDTDAGLLLRKDSGVVEKVMAGDVTHCR
ncbi:MAG: biotin--[acetyl-CoA-carboxylase] ligase [Candidatus Omnitrophota bacterium]